MSAVPTSVLAEALRAEIGTGSVRAAVFTTFTLEHNFLLDEVLPTLVPHTLSGNLVVRREELADHLIPQAAPITVYADAQQIIPASGGSRVPVSVVPVRHRTGVFHPKMTMVLVHDDKGDRLVVSVGSANLTRAGWWENVECAHVWSIREGASTWCQEDLLSFVEHVRRQSVHPSDRRAADQVATFLRGTSQRAKFSEKSINEPRFFWTGIRNRQGFSDWLSGLPRYDDPDSILEIISPWYSDTGNRQVDEVRDALGVSTVRVLVPCAADGRARMSASAVAELGDDVEWGGLPQAVTRTGEKNAAPRNVHAKAYRLLAAEEEHHFVVVGSVNLTSQAFATGQNVEAAVRVGVDEGGTVRWLEPTNRPTAFVAPEPEDEEGPTDAGVHLAPITVVVDWQTRAATVAWAGETAVLTVDLRAGALPVATVATTRAATALPEDEATTLLGHLQSSSAVLDVHHGPDHLGYTIVIEQNIDRKPSADTVRTLADAVADLLLDRAGRTARTGAVRGEDLDAAEADLDDVPVAAPSAYETQAALFQAMAQMSRDLHAQADDKLDAEVRYWLIGHGSRCLGDLLDLARALSATSPADALVVAWAVEDLLAGCTGALRKRFRRELDESASEAHALTAVLERDLVAANPADPEMARFLAWARASFVGATR